MKAEKKRVAVVLGGRSSEREISLASGRQVLAHLDPERFEGQAYDAATDLPRLAAEAQGLDVAFLALHGPDGEDGAMQGFCQMLALPYTGSGVLASAMAMDKEISKRVYRRTGLPVAEDILLSAASGGDLRAAARQALASLGSPLVVKPLRQGSSVGLSIAADEAALCASLSQVFALDGAALLEKYIQGREFTCAVLGNERLTALPPIEIIPAAGHSFFDYQAKYEPGQALEICPAEIPASLTLELARLARAAHEALGCQGLSRTDFMYAEGQLYLLETNTLPGLTTGSLLPKMAAVHGLSFRDLVSYLIDLALEPQEPSLAAYLQA